MQQRDMAYPGLHRLVDEGDAGDEYNFSPVDEPPLTQPERVGLAWTAEGGPLRGALERELIYRLPDGLSPDRGRRSDTVIEVPVRERVTLERAEARLDFTLELDNQATDHRLRVHFPIPFDVAWSHADTAYHVTRRPVIRAQLEEGASEWELPTYPMRSFVHLSDGRRGVTLVTHGLHEYEVLPGPPPVLALTLIRAVGWLSREDLRFRRGHAGPPLRTPGAQAFGPHRFQYSLIFHDGEWTPDAVWRLAEATLLPLQVAGIFGGSGEPQRGSASITLEPSTIQLTACIPDGDGYLLRLLNAADQAHEARVRFKPTPSRVLRVTLDGAPSEPVTLEGDTARFDVRPWEIATLRISP
ncbi:MAG TPA: glycoside hydrolase family 38 C-terminal domain-containing protein [Candidatus Dormibacteraeota bacterium]|nr:glycoside hydrolase family 38 C-terminal domain-containing protein [Candidatus Dormibacteraeota bacterium]